MSDLIPELLAGEQIDTLGYHGLRIIQNPQKFKFTIDAFLLAGFIDPKPRHHLIDLGTGSGVLPLLIAGQREVASVYGLEIQPELVSMAKRNVILNGLRSEDHYPGRGFAEFTRFAEIELIRLCHCQSSVLSADSREHPGNCSPGQGQVRNRLRFGRRDQGCRAIGPGERQSRPNLSQQAVNRSPDQPDQVPSCPGQIAFHPSQTGS